MCGLMVVTSGDCWSCLLVLVVAGLDMVVFRTCYRGLSGKLTRLVGCRWFFLLPASCLGVWEFEGKMVVTGQEAPSIYVINFTVITSRVLVSSSAELKYRLTVWLSSSAKKK